MAEIPETRVERMRGLLACTSMSRAHAMLFERTRSIHTFGMSCAITAAFVDRDLRVIAVRRMPPGRIALPRRSVRHVLELADGADVRPGDRLRRAR